MYFSRFSRKCWRTKLERQSVRNEDKSGKRYMKRSEGERGREKKCCGKRESAGFRMSEIVELEREFKEGEIGLCDVLVLFWDIVTV